MCSSAVDSQSLLCSQNVRIKAFWYTKDVSLFFKDLKLYHRFSYGSSNLYKKKIVKNKDKKSPQKNVN